MPDNFRIRRATDRDAGIIASQRARMFRDMGEVAGDAVEILRAKAETRLAEWLAKGNYLGWLAAPSEQPQTVVAGAGVQLHSILPRPVTSTTVGEGRLATVVNVFTEPDWRRRGVAGPLLQEIIAWSKNGKLDRLVLHASDDGRPVYERLGFVVSNEMRLVDNSQSDTVRHRG